MTPRLDLGSWAEGVVNWMLAHWAGFFDGIGAALSVLVEAVDGALQAPPAPALILILTAVPLLQRRWGLAVYTAAAMTLILSMDLWTETLESLALVVVATAAATLIGIPLGILASRSTVFSGILRPVLDFMQTTPAFVYLIPTVFFFGVGVVPGVVATLIFAIAPAVRFTELGIRQVDGEVREAADAFGASSWQRLREVELPLAMPTIMAGVNQVIMLALSMVVVAGLTGAGGLGSVVTTAVSQLDVAAGFDGGLAVVLLAIYLDRVTAGLTAGLRPGLRHRARRARSGTAQGSLSGPASPASTPSPTTSVPSSQRASARSTTSQVR
ncbi:ABC transporter permease [Raineyella sp. W15-4]|uniref:ABC transporter permease n=1 Tax=Raineyella sp. W15-4 TaxID=3081651 RepID=UPI0029533124|nr:ABC transporter permease subunit [Raineyella sp. W15-4]WOQ16356.1 ABC transporter permease subunit [Raineyella sp. W15-4]